MRRKAKIRMSELIDLLATKGYYTDRTTLLRAEKNGKLPFSFHKTLNGAQRFIFKSEFATVHSLLKKAQNGRVK